MHSLSQIRQIYCRQTEPNIYNFPVESSQRKDDLFMIHLPLPDWSFSRSSLGSNTHNDLLLRTDFRIAFLQQNASHMRDSGTVYGAHSMWHIHHKARI